MSIASNDLFNKEKQRLFSEINKYLLQVEALAVVATFIDTEAVNSDTLNHYLWTISDLLQNIRMLYDYLKELS